MKKLIFLISFYASSLLPMEATTAPRKVPPLIAAVKKGNLEEVKKLIKAKTDLEQKDRAGYTALMWAITCAHVRITAQLLNAGADIHAKLGGKELTVYDCTKELYGDVAAMRGNIILQMISMKNAMPAYTFKLIESESGNDAELEIMLIDPKEAKN